MHLMVFILVIVSAFVIFFSIVLFIPLAMHRIRSRRGSTSPQAPPFVSRVSPRSIIQVIGSLVTLSVISFVILRFSTKDVEEYSGVLSKEDEKYARIAPSELAGITPGNRPVNQSIPTGYGPVDEKDSIVTKETSGIVPARIDDTANDAANSGITRFDRPVKETDIQQFKDTFIPSTLTYYSDRSKASSIAGDPDKKTAPVFAKLQGGIAGDFFVFAFFDELRNGAFVRSTSLSVSPPGKSLFANFLSPETIEPRLLKKNRITVVSVDLPPLGADESFQLPFLINGSTKAAAPGRDEVLMRPDGEITSVKEIERVSFSYYISKSNNTAKFITETHDSTWLSWEYVNIPYVIQKHLIDAKSMTPEKQLFVIGSILDRYFGYQTGLEAIFRKRNLTWNAMLQDRISSNLRLLADCDVLCTYAYIFMKYLDLDPVLLLGFLNSGESPDDLNSSEVHSMLYVKAGRKWVLFDPTLFVKNYSLGGKLR